jgi:phosphomannomutase
LPHSTDAKPATLSCFKTYDVRGRVGRNLDEGIARSIGGAMVRALGAKRLAVGGDARLSTPALKAALSEGITAVGCDVLDLGLTGTEEIYFASMRMQIDGGVEVTASHNPADYNGFKFVSRKGQPLTDDEFSKLREFAEAGIQPLAAKPGKLKRISVLAEYVDHILAQVDLSAIRPLKLLADIGNGAAGHVIDEIERRFVKAKVPVTFIKINEKPDGTFPNGVPNPLLPQMRAHTIKAMREHGADIGLAWDGDFDRCFFYDGEARFVSGYYIAGLLMSHFIERHQARRFAIDCRLNWNSLDILGAAGATGIHSRTGHRFFKEVMRREDAVYGGEVSAHHYFQSFAYCDSVMLPWLLVIEHLGRNGLALAQAVEARQALYPSSEEINFEVADPLALIAALTKRYRERAIAIDFKDGVSIEMDDVRLNVESRGSEERLQACISELTRFITS